MPAPELPRPGVDAPSLPGRLVDLVRVEREWHGPLLWQGIGRHADLWAGTPTGPFADEPEFAAWLEARLERPDQALFAIFDNTGQGEEIAGLLFVISILPAMGTAELGLVYGPGLQRTTGGTEAVYLALRHLFETLAYRRVEWRCNVANEASLRAARRFGFTLEGVLRQHRWLKGANCDTALHAITDRDWPAIGRRLEAWLDPRNFSGDGRQITSLSAASGR